MDTTDLDIRKLRIRFKAKTVASVSPVSFQVGIITNPIENTNFTKIADVSVDAQERWGDSLYTVDFSTLGQLESKCQYVYIAFKHSRTKELQNIYIDDVIIDEIPEILEPKNFKLTATRKDTASFRWNATPGNEYDVKVEEFFNENWAEIYTSRTNTDSTSIQLLGSSSIIYRASIKAISGFKESPYTTPIVFRMPQQPDTIEVSENFDNPNPLGWTIVNDEQPAKWYQGNAVYHGASGKSIYISNDEGKHNAYEGGRGSTVHFYKDIYFPESNTTAYALSFDWKCKSLFTSSSTDYMQVSWIEPSVQLRGGEMPATDINSVSERFFDTSNISNWKNGKVYIGSISGVKRLVFTWTNSEVGKSGQIPVAIDNIHVFAMPCVMPTNLTLSNITDTSVNIGWRGENTNGFEVAYKETPSNTWILDTVFANLYDIKNLTANTRYDIRVQAICPEYINPSVTDSLRTPCKPYSLPFVGDFSVVPDYTWISDNCWMEYRERLTDTQAIQIQKSYNSEWYQDTLPDKEHNKNAVRVVMFTRDYEWIGDMKEWILTPRIDLGKTGETFLDFDIASNYNGINTTNRGKERLAILVSNTNEFETNNIIREWNHTNPVYTLSSLPNNGVHVRIPLSKYKGVVRIAFYAETDPKVITGIIPGRIFIANISVSKEECRTASQLQASVTSQYGADLSWAAPEGQLKWELRYGLAGSDISEMHAVFTEKTPSQSVNGLEPDKTYQFYVRTICQEGDTSDWSTPQKFHTAICPSISDLTAKGIGSTLATLSWAQKTKQESWQIRYEKEGSSEEAVYIDTNITTNALLELEPATKYKIGVRALCFTTNYSEWATTSFTTKNEGSCEPVYDIKVTDSAKVTWNGFADQNEWQLVYGIGITNPDTETPHTITGTKEFKIPTTKRATTYNIFVRNICSESVYSDWLVQDFTTPECDTALTLKTNDITSNSATVSWNSSSAHNGWDIVYVKKGQPIDSETPQNTTKLSFEIANLQANTSYDVYVRGICSDQSYSKWIKHSFTTHCGDAPELSFKNLTTTSVIVEWESQNGQNKWQVGYNSKGSSFNAMISHVISNQTEFTISGLILNTQYDIYIRALCSNGDTSGWSNPLTIKTKNCEAVDNLESRKLSGSAYLVTWNAVEEQNRWETRLVKNETEIRSNIVSQKSDTVTLTEGEEHLYTIWVRAICDEAYSDRINISFLDISNIERIKNQITLSPNPAKDLVRINWGMAKGLITVSVFDLNGKMILQKQVNAHADSFTEFPLQTFAKGMYSIRIQHADWIKSEKLVIQ